MSNRIVKSDQKNNHVAGSGVQITGQIIEYLLTIVLLVLCVAVCFYAKDGYHGIGNAKFAAYKAVMLRGGILLLAALVPYLVFRLMEHRRLRVSVTDGFVLAYLIFSGISVFSGGFWRDDGGSIDWAGILWGYKGWNMGLFAQVSFVFLYLMLSRFGRYYRLILTVLCAAAGGVYGIGILHRRLIDPIGFYDGLSYTQKAQFLSTLGQASWYGSFLAVTLPVGIGVFVHAAKRQWRVAGGVFTVLGFCTLVTQNSDSAYIGLAGAMIALFVTVAGEREKLCRYMGALTLFFISGKVMGYLVRLRPNPELQADFVTRLMWDSWLTWILLLLCLASAVLLFAMGARGGKRQYPVEWMKRAGRIVPVMAVSAVLIAALMIFLQTRGALPQVISDRLAKVSYFNWNDAWGNGRGRIWHFGAKLYAEAKPIHKLFGVGPDCFHSYVVTYYGEEAELLWGTKQLTNAHNEWMTMLINGGFFGAAAYLGIYVTSVGRLVHACRQNALISGIAAAVVSYMCYNFFCYQQVLCTPFVFICMGIGEYILREQAAGIRLSVDKTRRCG